MSLKQRLVVASIAGVFGIAGPAFALTKDQVKAENDRIAVEFKTARAKCDGLKANAKDICMAEARGASDVAKAELEARQKNTPRARYNVQVAKADAQYDVAKERCDDLSGNARNVCVKDAKATLTRAKADAKVGLEADSAQREGSERVDEARREAGEDKREADYAAAKERCDRFNGEVRDRCIADAKARLNVK